MPNASKTLPEVEIRARYLKGAATIDELAKEYKTHRSRIRRICGVEIESAGPSSEPPDPEAPEEPKFYEVAIQMTEKALDGYIASFTPQEKAIALEAVLVSRVG